MRLLNANTLEFEEFYDYQIPKYAILSHRWGPPSEEVSYNDYISGRKKNTAGYEKIVRLCYISRSQALAYCWIDTCCIDKSSSAELSEAINSMFSWYQRAQVCYAYLADVHGMFRFDQSDWFKRGWTLQELIAPERVIFLDNGWREIGDWELLAGRVVHVTGIDRALLNGETGIDWYSNAQIMSWAAGRTTSRLEDEAYCLLGLLGVNMPLLYGEGSNAFRRLQEVIMTKMEDNSLFLWGGEALAHGNQIGHSSLLAASPRDFRGCDFICKGLSSQRILFEVTNQGIMVSLHRSYDPDGLGELVRLADEHVDSRGHEILQPLGLTIPLGSYRRARGPLGNARFGEEGERWSYFLQLVLESGKWRRIGVTSRYNQMFWEDALYHQGLRFLAYTNNYVRIYIHHDRSSQKDCSLQGHRKNSGMIQYIHLKDVSLAEKSAYDASVSKRLDWQ